MDLVEGLPREFAEIAHGFGLYVHIPFCSTRCDYCAFATWTGREELVERYVDALCLEIDRAKERGRWRSPDTVFFGGGTPSLLSVEQVARVLDRVVPGASTEISLECNPESTDADFLAGIAGLGVNRISLGVQSTKPHVLKGLGRTYQEGSISRVLDAIARAEISNYNVDLVFGGAGESAEDFAEGLLEVLDFSPSPAHISAYALTVESGTPLSRSPDRHPDDDVLAERYESAEAILGAHGFHWYEISNWAKPGAECRHNLSCWLGGDYLGIGCAAHSHLSGERSANVFSVDRYVEAIFSSGEAIARSEFLDSSGRAAELAALLLRTRLGVPRGLVDESLVDDGLMERDGERATLTVRGRLLANEVAIRLLSRPEQPSFAS
ncbi:MAG TPA: radical SAM family heme chaperone HemW [Acidimicrobiales bacterium]|nr:radical SAM family heme chaperone HemW [Acidimicrobiales bacterium]